MMEITEDLTSNNQEEKSIEDILADAEPEVEEAEAESEPVIEEIAEPEVEVEPEPIIEEEIKIDNKEENKMELGLAKDAEISIGISANGFVLTIDMMERCIEEGCTIENMEGKTFPAIMIFNIAGQKKYIKSDTLSINIQEDKIILIEK